MTEDSRQRIETLFHEVLELEPMERAAFLDSACDGDETLRREVESLLAHNTENFLKSNLAQETSRLLADDHNRSVEGQTVDHYKILSLLGAGGMGEVYLAEDVRLGRKVALKLLPTFFTRNADQVRRFHHEARAASSLNHPNIVTIHELGQSDSLHFIAMELVDGETLRQQMERTRIAFRDVLNVALQVASGLSAAHQAGIIHRDIKPENIMFGNDGYVKVLDFGIAKFKEQQSALSDLQSELASTGNTQASAIAGTLSYMSPEQARGEPLDARTDIFSLGTLLYEMVAGRRPVERGTQAETLHAILNCEAQSLRALRQDVPPDLERIIGKALKKDRDERYQSAKDMLADLREFNEEADTAMDAKERANRMLRQYLSIYAADRRALIPIAKLWSIRRYSDLERGERARELLKKSLRSGLLKAGALVLVLSVVTTVAAAALSMSEEWEGVKLSDGHTRAARQAAFSPDGKRLVTVGEDATVIVWDFEKRQRLATFTDHTAWVVTVAFSPDGEWFATGSWDHTVIVWEANRLEKARTLTQHQGPVIAVAFSPNGQLLASVSTPPPDNREVSSVNQIALWSVERGEKLQEIQGTSHEDFGTLFFSRDGRWLSFESGEHWDVNTGQKVSDEVVGWSGRRKAISRDGTRQVAMGGSGGVGITDLIRRKTVEFSPRQAHQDSGRAAAFSPDGRLLATGADDIILWDADTPKIITHLEYDAIVWHLAFSPNGRWLVSSHGDGSILVWDAAEGRRVAAFNGHSGAVRGVAFSPSGKQIASASEDGSVIIWDADGSRKEAVLVGDGLRANAVAFSQDGAQAAQCENGHSIFLWDLKQQQPRITVRTKYGSSYCIAISPDGRWLASTQGVYDSADGHQVVEFGRVVPQSWQMYGVAFSPDGRWLACVTPLRFIHLFDTENWQLRSSVEVSDAQFICVSFAGDNKHLVTGDDEGTVRLWEIEPLRQVAVLGRHTSRIKSVAFSPDGREVASAGDDQTIRLWDVGRRRLIKNIGTHTSPVLSVAFSPDGKRLVSGEHDHSVRLWTRHRTLWGRRLD